MSKLTINDRSTGGGDMVYCLGIIGTIVYYWQHASSFGEYVVGFLKALVWPAFLIHKIMEFLSM